MIVKNKFPLFLLFSVIFFGFSFNFSLAYEPIPTHRDLTKKIVEIYNKYYEPKITQEQAQWIINGAIKEDTVPRWINHFYDPVYKSGWSGEKQGDVPQDTVKKLSKIFISTSDAASSLVWIHNQTLQEKYGLYEGNNTYERALSAYAYSMGLQKGFISEAYNYASFENAFKALGHTLHLLEDLGVPAHTRNDTHADVPGSGDNGEPYETWVALPGNNNLSVLDNLNINGQNFNCQKIDDCFINLAKYTNENFYSKDTVEDKNYKIIKADGILEGNKKDIYFRKDNFGNEYSFKIHIKKDNKDTIEDSLIHQSYWNLLSKQIVLAGVKTIQIFYEDANKEMEIVQFPTHVVSFNKCDIPFICSDTIVSPFGELSRIAGAAGKFLSSAINTTKNILASVSSTVKNIFGGNSDFKQVGEVAIDQTNQENKNNQDIAIFKDSAVKEKESQITDLKKEISLLNKKLNQQDKVLDQTIITSTIVKDSAAKTIKTISAGFCKFSTSQKPQYQRVLINEIAWMGSIKSAADEWMELKNISNAEVDLTNWQLISKDGQIKINFSDLKNRKIGSGSYVLLERTDDNSVPGITADFIYKGGLSNMDETLRLFDSSCNLIDEVSANPDWPAGDNSAKKTMERNTDNSSLSLSNQFGWHTSANAGGTSKKENSQQQAVYSGGGGGEGGGVSATNNSQTTSQPTPQFYEIVINEIMYSLDGDDSGREWVEIFNKSSSSVDLSGFKLSEGGTNHGLTLKQGNKNLALNSYAILANDIDKFLIDHPGYAGTIFYSSFSLKNDGELITFKNGDLKIDEVIYASSTGANGNGKSLQLINGEWKESAPTPGAANALDSNSANATETISAKFSFSPSEPKENEQITFNAASSTASSGSISLYEWQFSDNTSATSTEPIINYAFSAAGIYTAQLIVYDDDNASSTASVAITIVSASQEQIGTNHVLISEIMPGIADNANNEFVEFYNPTDKDISLFGWALKRKSSETASSTNLVLNFKATSTIAAKSFFLIAHNSYTGISDFRYTNNSNPLANNGDIVILQNGEEIIDEVVYPAIIAGQSFERKSFLENSCVFSQASGEYLGNGCDTDDEVNDFEIRVIPNPQNSSSLPEPRSAPSQIQNFNAVYNDAGPQLALSWNSAVDYSGATSTLVYKISDVSLNPTLSIIETTSTKIQISINEIGRVGDNTYKFSIRAFDGNGLGSTSTIVSVDAPGFMRDVYFYKDSVSQNNYIEGYYNKYPFIPERFPGPSWKVVIFYLNQEASTTASFDEAAHWGGSSPGAVKIVYEQCAGGDIIRGSLILPDDIGYCLNTWGGERNAAFLWSNLEDNHFIVKLNSSNPVFKDGDYVTSAFYAYGGDNNQVLVAVDRNKYFLKNSIDWQASPKFPDQSRINLNFDKASSKLNISWPKATDVDTIDSLITYEIKYATSSEWQIVSDSGHATGTEKIVVPGDDFQISVRAKDNFGNFDSNQILSAAWAYPPTTFYITQIVASTWSMSFGDKNVNCVHGGCSGSASLQSIMPKDSFQFNKVVLRLYQSTASDYSNLRLRIYKDNSGMPDLNNLLGETIISGLYAPNPDSDITFSFNSPISVTANNTHWFYLDVSNYSDPGGFFRNYWKNAISTTNDYLEGDAGFVNSADSPQYTVPYPSGGDWYMKIGLEQN